MLEKIGTEKRMICGYDGLEHLVRVTDYAVIVSGNTYPIKGMLYSKYHLYWERDSKTWTGIINSAEELKDLFHDIPGDVRLQAKANWRIMDLNG